MLFLIKIHESSMGGQRDLNNNERQSKKPKQKCSFDEVGSLVTNNQNKDDKID